MLLKFDGLDVLDTDVDWAGADGSTDKDVGPLPQIEENQDSDVQDEKTRYDNTFGEFREKLVEHFMYKARHRELAWTYTSRPTRTSN